MEVPLEDEMLSAGTLLSGGIECSSLFRGYRWSGQRLETTQVVNKRDRLD